MAKTSQLEDTLHFIMKFGLRSRYQPDYHFERRELIRGLLRAVTAACHCPKPKVSA